MKTIIVHLTDGNCFRVENCLMEMNEDIFDMPIIYFKDGLKDYEIWVKQDAILGIEIWGSNDNE